MAFIPAPDTAELVATYTMPNGNQAKNVLNFRDTLLQGWDAATLQALITAYVNWENATAKALRSSQVSLTSVLARDMSVQNGAVVEQAAAIPGTNAGANMPSNVTLSVKHVTGLAGRSFRGRTYWIGLSETMVTGDFVIVATGNAIVAAMNALRTTLQPQGFYFVIVSRYSNNAPRTTAVVTNVLASQVIDMRVDTQRRRLPGEGS